MKKLLEFTTNAIVSLLVVSFGLVGHVSAMPMGEHSSMTHRSFSPADCLNTCINVTHDKVRSLPTRDEEDEDDTPIPPQYLQLKKDYPIELLSEKSNMERLTVKRPPKVPPYILYTVFRN